MTQDITLDIDDGIALVTFNRPDTLNTFTAAMLEGLSDIYRRCDSDDAVKVVVLTGAGKAFCAGADLAADSFEKQEGDSFSSCPLSFQAWQVRKPVIAACNGHAIGVGMGMAMQADLRVFAEEGKYGFLQVRRGVVADFAMHYLLPRLVGLENALELILTGRRLSGVEAREMGLAGRTVPADKVLETALGLAREMIANCSPLVMALSKRMIWQGLDLSMAQMENLETRLLHHTMGKPDTVEGAMAFFEKRPPQWTGMVNEDWPEGFL